ncbi:hypothetical protein GCM10010336_63410 [Streptomyces goshikiensis]|nr:hypothetical protein GCM10010336_63410 [Streptomyces goshikiensis]
MILTAAPHADLRTRSGHSSFTARQDRRTLPGEDGAAVPGRDEGQEREAGTSFHLRASMSEGMPSTEAWR